VAATVHQFGKLLVATGLMTSDEVKACWSLIAPDVRPADAAGFARRLVDTARLTEFQAAELLAGRGDRLVLGDYLLLAEIGAGGMGRVFKAQHRGMKRVVALKVLSNAAMNDAEAIKRFQREVEAAARLEHPNIVTAYDSGTAGSVKYLVMQFVEGCDLSELIRRDGPLPLATAVDYAIQTASGLAFAHVAGVIHRDIKPANLLLDKKGVVKILDMGLASFDGSGEGLTGNEQVMGTVDYMSPEQGYSTKGVDARTDIYSLGCTLWFLLTGKKVFEADTVVKRVMAHRDAPLPSLRNLRSDVPNSLERAVHRMLAKRAGDRFGSMNEVIAALKPFTEGGDASTINRRSPSENVAGRAPPFEPLGAALAKTSTSVDIGSPRSRTASKGIAAPAQAKRLGESETDPITRTISIDVGAERSPPTAAPLQLTPAVAGRNRKPKTKKLIAAGFVGAALLLAGIIIKVKDKDGNVVAELNVPDAASVEVIPTVDKPAASVPTATSAATGAAVASPTSQPSPTDVTAAAPTSPAPQPPIGPSAREILTSPDYVWSKPEPVKVLLDSGYSARQPALSADELCMVFSASGNTVERSLMECRRPGLDGLFDVPKSIPGTVGAIHPSLSGDGLQLFYANKIETSNAFDIWLRRRKTRDVPWGPPENLGSQVNATVVDSAPNISPDGLTLMFSSDRGPGRDVGGSTDIWIARRRSSDAPFEQAINAGLSLNTAGRDINPRQLAEDLALICHEPNGRYSLAVKDSMGKYSETPLKGLPKHEFGEHYPNEDLWVSPDGRRIYFSSPPDAVPVGRREFWVTRRITRSEAASAAKNSPLQPVAVLRPGLRFRGADYVDLGGDWKYDGGDLTFEAWLIPESGQDIQTLLAIEQQRDGVRYGAQIVRDGRNQTWHAVHSGAQRHPAFAESTVPPGPIHLAVVCSGADRLFFLNGRRYAALQGMPPVTASAQPPFAWLGAMPSDSAARAPQFGWKGTLLQARLSSRARYVDSFEPPKIMMNDSATQFMFYCGECKGDVLKDMSAHKRDGKIVSGEWVAVEIPAGPMGPPPLRPPLLPDPDAAPITFSTAYLDDLQEKSWSGNGALIKHGRGPNGVQAALSGRPVEHSLYVPPRPIDNLSIVEYELDAHYDHFSIYPVLLKRPSSPVVFRILCDGKPHWESPPLTEPLIESTFGRVMMGVKKIRLEVSGPADAQPMWSEPYLGPPLSSFKAKPPAIDPLPGPWIDVLPLFKPDVDKFDIPNVTEKNDWRIEKGELHYRGDDAAGCLLWPLEFNGPGLEFEVEFTRIRGDRGLTLCVPTSAGNNIIAFDVAQPGKAVFSPGATIVGAACSVTTGKRMRLGLHVKRNYFEDLIGVSIDGLKTSGFHHIRPQGTPTVGNIYYAAAWKQFLRIEANHEYVFHSIRARTLQGGAINPLPDEKRSVRLKPPMPGDGPVPTLKPTPSVPPPKKP
jgi:serine/threonine protein kinase